MTPVMTKKPDDVLDYDIDFAWWMPAGDRIVSAETSIADTTAVIDQTEISDTQVKVWISGGAADDNGTVTVDATTLNGRTKSVCFRLRIKGC